MARFKLPPLSQVGKIIIGIGNPGSYSDTRHNIGKRFVFDLVRSYNLTFQPLQGGHFAYLEKKNQEKLIGFFITEGFMNETGKLIRPLLEVGKIENFVVAHDFLDAGLGVVKIKEGGSAEGHNGIRSIIQSLGGKDSFCRLKIGIGRPSSKDPEVISRYVLGKFSPEERMTIKNTVFPLCVKTLKKIVEL